MRGSKQFFVRNRTISDFLLFPFEKSWFTCEKCFEHQIGSEFLDFADPTKHFFWCKACRLKYPMPITDGYVRGVLRQGLSVPASVKWPDAIMKLVRLKTQLRWLRKHHENHQRHSRTAVR